MPEPEAAPRPPTPGRRGIVPARAATALGAVLAGALLAPAAARAGNAQDGLRFVEWQSQVPVELEGAFDGVLSSSGRSLYVASLLDDAILHYRRDPLTGALSIRQAIGPGVVDAPADLAIAPGGGDVYAAAILSDAVFHLERDVNSGALESIAPAPDPVGQPPLDGASSVALAPDGSRLYAVGLDDQRLFVYDRAADGTLSTPTPFLIALIGARDVAVSPDGQDLYIAELHHDRLRVLRPQANGTLLIVQTLDQGVGGIAGLDGPYTVATSPDGADVYVTGFEGGTLTHFDRDPATGELTQVQVFGNGGGGVASLPGALGVAVSDDGGSVYVTSSDQGGAVFVFTRDAATGALTFVRTYDVASDPLSGLTGAAGVLTEGDSVVVLGLLEHAVSVWERTAPGALRRIETQRDQPPLVLFPQQVVAVPGSSGLLVFGYDDCGAGQFCIYYSTLVRDRRTGALTAVARGDFAPFTIGTADGAAISADGRHLYLASFGSDAILALEVAPGGTALTPVDLYVDGVGGVDGLAGVQDLVVSPDGAFVYAAGQFDDVVTRFARDPATGALTWLDTLAAPRPLHIAQSRDGRHLYVTAGGSSLLAFARDPASGALTQVDVETEGVGGVTGLAVPIAVAVSGDGRSVYVTDRAGPRLAAFARDPATGTLTWFETYDQGGMDEPFAVAVEASGGHVYVAGALDGTVAVYRRDRTTGELLYLRTEGSSAFDPLRLRGTHAYHLSPDGRHLYIPALDDQALAVFSTDDLFVDGFETGDPSAWSGVQSPP